MSAVLRVPSGAAYWELFSTSYGPKTLADSLGDRREELRCDWVDFFETNHRVDGEIAHPREYLLRAREALLRLGYSGGRADREQRSRGGDRAATGL